MAQKEGFEPSRAFWTPTPLAGEPLRPLGYFCKLKDFNTQKYQSQAFYYNKAKKENTKDGIKYESVMHELGIESAQDGEICE